LDDIKKKKGFEIRRGRTRSHISKKFASKEFMDQVMDNFVMGVIMRNWEETPVRNFIKKYVDLFKMFESHSTNVNLNLINSLHFLIK
jgi:hypothetical protein